MAELKKHPFDYKADKYYWEKLDDLKNGRY